MKEELLQVKDLSFAYEEKQVLKNISVSIFRGERLQSWVRTEQENLRFF